MMSYKKSKKKLLKNKINKKLKLNKKNKSFKKRQMKKQKGGYDKQNCLVSLREILEANEIKDKKFSDDELLKYSGTIIPLRNLGMKQTYGNTPYTKQLIDYFYDCISKGNNNDKRVNVHEGLYIEL